MSTLYKALEDDGIGVDMVSGAETDGEFIRAVELIVEGFDADVVAWLRYYGPKCTLCAH